MLPKALYDNPDQLSSPMPDWLCQHLDALNLPGVHEEYTLVSKFLLMYDGSRDTFKSYRRESERFCQWAWLVYGGLLKHVDRHGLAQYFHFIQNPPKEWVAKQSYERFILTDENTRVPNLSWRPFLSRSGQKSMERKTHTLSKASMRACMASVSTLMSFFQQEGYVMQNPVFLLRQKSRFLHTTQSTRVIRKLSSKQWEALIGHMSDLAERDERFERHVFIFSAFFLLGLRISELAESDHRSPVMGDFFSDSKGLWWFRTVGKGNKYREVAVPDAMLVVLGHYRRSLGLAHLPYNAEPFPLVPKLRGEGNVSIRHLRKIVQEGFDATCQMLKENGREEDAQAIAHATVHWLRHTAISHDVTSRPREHVRDDCGHQSVSITDRYVDIALEERHASARFKALKPSEPRS